MAKLTLLKVKIVKRIKEILIKKDKIATGKLLNSIKVDIDRKKNVYKFEIRSLDYLKYIEYGRKPGKFPPIDKIKSWIKAKKIKSDLNIDALAFLISRKIAKKGTKGINTIEKELENIIKENQHLIFEGLEINLDEIFNYKK